MKRFSGEVPVSRRARRQAMREAAQTVEEAAVQPLAPASPPPSPHFHPRGSLVKHLGIAEIRRRRYERMVARRIAPVPGRGRVELRHTIPGDKFVLSDYFNAAGGGVMPNLGTAIFEALGLASLLAPVFSRKRSVEIKELPL